MNKENENNIIGICAYCGEIITKDNMYKINIDDKIFHEECFENFLWEVEDI